MLRALEVVEGVDRSKLVLLAAFLLFIWNLWGYDLWAPDEPYFGEGAREMVVDGGWLVPHVNGEITTDKPPLFFWLISLFSMLLGGVSSFTARIPSVLAALGTIALTMRMGRRMDGPWPAALAGAVLMTTHMFWEKARSAQIDSLLCFLVTLAVAHFAAFRSGEMEGHRAGNVFWLAAAFAVLAKGLVGFIVPLGIAVVTLAFDRNLRSWRRFAPVSGPLLFLSVIAAWIAVVSIWGGEYSVVGAFREHVVERAVHGMHHEQPPWYYLTVLPYALLPWSFLLPGALWLAYRRRSSPDDRFLLVYFLFVVVFFSIPTEKRDLYILPSVPAFALMASRLVAVVAVVAGRGSDDVQRSSAHRRWVTIPQGVIGAIFVLAAVAAPMASTRIGPELLVPAMGLAVVFGLGGIAIVVAASRGAALRSVALSGATIGLAMIVAVSLVYPAVNPEKSARELAGVVSENRTGPLEESPVIGFDLGNVTRGINFYTNGLYLDEIQDPDELVARLGSSRDAILVIGHEDTLPDLSGRLDGDVTALYRTRLSRRDLVFLRFEPR